MTPRARVSSTNSASSSYDSDTGSSSNPLFISTYSYDGLGRTAKVTITLRQAQGSRNRAAAHGQLCLHA